MFVWWTKCTSFIRVRLTLNQFIVWGLPVQVQYIPRNMHTVFALLCFVVVILWLIFPYPSGLLHWHCGNITIAPVPAKQPWWIWINTSCEFIINDCITTTKQSTRKTMCIFLGIYCTSTDTTQNNIIHHATQGTCILSASISRHLGLLRRWLISSKNYGLKKKEMGRICPFMYIEMYVKPYKHSFHLPEYWQFSDFRNPVSDFPKSTYTTCVRSS